MIKDPLYENFNKALSVNLGKLGTHCYYVLTYIFFYSLDLFDN